MRIAMMAAAMALLLIMLLSLPAAADQGAGSAAAATVSLTTTAAPQGRVLLAAQLTGPGGRPISNADVHFYVRTNFFGSRLMFLGSSVTDTSGAASVMFEPTWTGTHQFQASFDGGDAYLPASGKASFDVARVVPQVRPGEAPGIPVIRRATGLLGLAATVAVWIVLLTVVARVVLGISAKRDVSPEHAGAWKGRQALQARRG